MSNFKFNWGYGIVLALLSFIIFILSLIFLFPIGKQNSDLVSKDYYGDELAYQDVIDAKNYANTLYNKPIVKTTEFGFITSFPKEVQAKNVHFYLYRIDVSEYDIKKNVDLDKDNEFIIPKKVLEPGTYIHKLYWEQDGKKCQIDSELLWK